MSFRAKLEVRLGSKAIQTYLSSRRKGEILVLLGREGSLVILSLESVETLDSFIDSLVALRKQVIQRDQPVSEVKRVPA